MAGVNHKVISKVPYDFSSVTAGQFQEQLVAKAIPCFQYREAVLLVRYHAQPGSAIAAGQTVDIRVRTEAPSSDDPTADFVATTDLCVAQITSSLTAPTLVMQPLVLVANGYFGPYLRVVARGTQSGGGGSLLVYLSIDLSFKAT